LKTRRAIVSAAIANNKSRELIGLGEAKPSRSRTPPRLLESSSPSQKVSVCQGLACSGLTFRLTDPAPVASDFHTGRSHGVRCSPVVRFRVGEVKSLSAPCEGQV
jgi:hypothetical protein